MRNETGIDAIPFKYIPPKVLDVSPMDYCTFVLLKQAHYKRHNNIRWTLKQCGRKMERNHP